MDPGCSPHVSSAAVLFCRIQRGSIDDVHSNRTIGLENETLETGVEARGGGTLQSKAFIARFERLPGTGVEEKYWCDNELVELRQAMSITNTLLANQILCSYSKISKLFMNIHCKGGMPIPSSFSASVLSPSCNLLAHT